MKITTIGIDLAKEVFQIHGVDDHGKTVLRKQLRRNKMTNFFANLEPCLIGMEACGSSHHWARKLGEFGHTVKLMSPQFVKPYVKTNKHDMADAEAICEAVGRPNMRFVPIKNIEQQLSCQCIVLDKAWSRPEPHKQIRYVVCSLNLVL
jgi:transposase